MQLPDGLWLSLLAEAEPEPAVTHWLGLPDTFFPGLFTTIVFGLVGIALAVLGFKVFDWITPRLDVQKELAEKHNVAVAIVIAAVILGVCYIVAHVVR